MQPPEGQSQILKPDQLLQTLQQLLELPITNLHETIHQTAQLVAQALRAEKVDVFLADPDQQQLRAYGVSQTPMGFEEIEEGLDCLPIADSGWIGDVYRTGHPYQSSQAQKDSHVLPGFKEELQVRSLISAPLLTPDIRQGVVAAFSSLPNFFSEQDLRFLESVGRWAGIVVQHAQLVELQTAAAAEQAKQVTAGELLAVMAHDLRNFLTPLKGHVDLLERRARKEGQEPYVRKLDMISQGMERFQRLLTDLLDVERLTHGAFTLQPRSIDLVAVVREMIPIWHSAEHPITLQAPESLLIQADPDRLLQVMENLLSNATSHAKPRSEITIVVSQHEREGSPWAFVTVSNWGEPLPAGQCGVTFQPFTKGPRSQGFGMGLYIAQRITQAHHGMLTARVEAEGQTHFTLALPLQ